MQKFLRIALASLLVVPSHAFAAADEEERLAREEIAQCTDPSFIEFAQDNFACEVDWSFSACRSLTLATAVAGAPVGALIGRAIANRTLNKFAPAFANYNESLDRQNLIRYNKWAASTEANAINRQFDDAFRKYYLTSPLADSREAQRNYDVQKNNAKDPKKFAEAEERFRLAHEKARASSILETAEEKTTAAFDKRWWNKINSPKMAPSVSESFKNLRMAEANYMEATFDVANPKGKRAGESQPTNDETTRKFEVEQAAYKQDLDTARKTFRERIGMFIEQYRNNATARGAVIGGIVGFSAAAAPFILQIKNNFACKELSKQERAMEYVDVSGGIVSGCSVNLRDDKELKLLTMPEHERNDLFRSQPLLCRTLLKKHQARSAKFKTLSVKPEILNCSKDGVSARIEIDGRSYNYAVKNIGGNLEITSPFGVSGAEATKDPVTINWRYNSEKNKIVYHSVYPTSALPSGLRSNRAIDSDLLTQFYRISADSKIKPISQQPASDKGMIRMTANPSEAVVKQMAEQSYAMKMGLPEVLSKCAFGLERVVESDIPTATPTPAPGNVR